ncbi:hypothetical protein ACI2L5_46770 [Streptomyces milbemycinicus]|uniref:Uncharacterized protein n=1 Tax=Streptomyces milbemycinicus TaxID=476552 RepID=A0ABW8M7E4_9ACTN
MRRIGPDGILSGRLHYDTEARTTRYTDSQGNTTTYVCNEAYKVIAETDLLGNTTRRTWDENNRHPLTITDLLGHTTHCRYDDQGRLMAVVGPDGTVTEAVYNDWGLSLKIREQGGAIWRHTYDQHGSRTSTAHSTYGTSGHLASVTDPRSTPMRQVCLPRSPIPVSHDPYPPRPAWPRHSRHQPAGAHDPPRLDNRG